MQNINNTVELKLYKGKSYALEIEGIEHKYRMVKIRTKFKNPLKIGNIELNEVINSFDIDLEILVNLLYHYDTTKTKSEINKIINKLVDVYDAVKNENEYIGSIFITDYSVYSRLIEMLNYASKIHRLGK